ncbi:MAG: 5'-nucleotidase C-terminal domain-containing protein [Oscillospiraceae bacterium]|nr:5'-nucleotidase C-terminal domain-containing protein [Oscillospiraceae bacterium]
MKKLFSIILMITLLVIAMPTVVFADTDVVTVYHTNDVHGWVESSYDEDGNLTKLGLEHVAAVHKANPDSILVDAGDFSQGALFANLAHGLSVYEAMNAAGYDVAALGNHEFDWGVAEFEENAKVLEFPVISANIKIEAGKENISPILAAMPDYVVKEVNGHKIVFFALDTSQLNGMCSPSTLAAGGIVTRTDLTNVAEEVVAKIKAEVPDYGAIIALTHCGYAENAATETSWDVAQVDGIDVVIDAHDHENRLGDLAKNVNGTLVVSTGTQIQHIGALELTFDGDKLAGIRSYDAGPEAAELEPDAETLSVIQDWTSKFDEIKNQVVFKSEINFWGGNLNGFDANNEPVTASIARRGYTNAGALISDSRIWAAKRWLDEYHDMYDIDPNTPIVGIFGGGSVRGSFRAGDVTLGGLMSCYSFSFEDAKDTLVMITPKVLYDAIEHGVNIFQSQDPETGMLTADGSIHGRFPQAGGFSYVYDITQPASSEYDKDNLKMPDTIGTRVLSITLEDGTLLDRNDNETKLILVTGSYEIGGGDSYWMMGVLNDSPNYGGYQYIEEIASPEGNAGDVLVEYVNEVYGGVVPADKYPLMSDRIVRVNDVYTGTSFNSTVTVTTNGEDAIANTAVTVYVDGEPSDFTTDGEGKFTIEGLANGAHEIRILGDRYDSGSIYLDNYCGLVNPVASSNPGEIPLGVEPTTEPEPAPAPAPAPAPTKYDPGWGKVAYALIGLLGLACACYLFLTVDKWGNKLNS